MRLFSLTIAGRLKIAATVAATMRQSISIISLSLIILLATSFASTERVNKSEASTGLFWSTAKEEGDLLRKAQTDDDSSSLLLGDNQEEHQLDGGFSSLEGMLQWAIGTFLFLSFSIVYLRFSNYYFNKHEDESCLFLVNLLSGI